MRTRRGLLYVCLILANVDRSISNVDMTNTWTYSTPCTDITSDMAEVMESSTLVDSGSSTTTETTKDISASINDRNSLTSMSIVNAEAPNTPATAPFISMTFTSSTSMSANLPMSTSTTSPLISMTFTSSTSMPTNLSMGTSTTNPSVIVSTTNSSTTVNTTSSTTMSILDTLLQPLYFGPIIAAIVVILFVLCFCIISCMICCIKTSRAEKEKNKEPLTAVHWSVEGGVTFLGAKEITKEESEIPADLGSIEDLAKREEGKASVTVASFGFPQVTIQPPEPSNDLDTSENKEEEKEDKGDGAKDHQSISTFAGNDDATKSEKPNASSFPDNSADLVPSPPPPPDAAALSSQQASTKAPTLTSSPPGNVAAVPMAPLVPVPPPPPPSLGPSSSLQPSDATPAVIPAPPVPPTVPVAPAPPPAPQGPPASVQGDVPIPSSVPGPPIQVPAPPAQVPVPPPVVPS